MSVALAALIFIAGPAYAAFTDNTNTRSNTCGNHTVSTTVTHRLNDQGTQGTGDDTFAVKPDGSGGLFWSTTFTQPGNVTTLEYSWRRLNGQQETVVIDSLWIQPGDQTGTVPVIEDFISNQYVSRDNKPWTRVVVNYQSGDSCAVNNAYYQNWE